MAFDQPFQSLRPDHVRYLSVSANQAARKVYLDIFALVQDMLLRYSSSPVHSMFENSEVPAAIIDQLLASMPPVSYVPRSLASSGSVNSQQSEANEIRQRLIELAKINKDTAVDLCDEYLAPTIRIGRDSVRQYIDDYLSDLSAQVRILRYPNTQPLEATA